MTLDNARLAEEMAAMREALDLQGHLRRIEEAVIKGAHESEKTNVAIAAMDKKVDRLSQFVEGDAASPGLTRRMDLMEAEVKLLKVNDTKTRDRSASFWAAVGASVLATVLGAILIASLLGDKAG